MKKYLIWIPVIGIFTTAYYQLATDEPILDSNDVAHFFGSALWQGVTTGLIIVFLLLH